MHRGEGTSGDLTEASLFSLANSTLSLNAAMAQPLPRISRPLYMLLKTFCRFGQLTSEYLNWIEGSLMPLVPILTSAKTGLFA